MTEVASVQGLAKTQADVIDNSSLSTTVRSSTKDKSSDGESVMSHMSYESFSDDSLIVKIREVWANSDLDYKQKVKSIVEYYVSCPLGKARTQNEAKRIPNLNTQMLETADLWYDKKAACYKIKHQVVSNVSTYGTYFLEVVKALGPIRWNVQPVMAASDAVVPLHLRTAVPMKLPAEGCGLCLAFSVARALAYMGKKRQLSLQELLPLIGVTLLQMLLSWQWKDFLLHFSLILLGLLFLEGIRQDVRIAMSHWNIFLITKIATYGWFFQL